MNMIGSKNTNRDSVQILFYWLDNLYEKFKDEIFISPQFQFRYRLIKLIDKGSQITSLPPGELLDKLDFNPNKLTIEYMESFIAELRSIFWLRNFGFTDIRLIKGQKKKKAPDFEAKYGEKDCAIEVFCLTQIHGQQKHPKLGVYVNFDPNFKGSKFGRDFMSKARKKKKQLDSTQADMKILLCVVNSEPMLALNDKLKWGKHVQLLYKMLGWGNGYYIGILTGVEVNGKLTDTIFPKLPTVIYDKT